MSKHTPGPWTVSQHAMLTSYQITAPSTRADGLSELVAHGANEPDARLIAAAPQLLEIAERILAWAGERNLLGGETGRLVNDAREVVALATNGEVPA